MGQDGNREWEYYGKRGSRFGSQVAAGKVSVSAIEASEVRSHWAARTLPR